MLEKFGDTKESHTAHDVVFAAIRVDRQPAGQVAEILRQGGSSGAQQGKQEHVKAYIDGLKSKSKIEVLV